jgi:hypothetical protein
MSDSTAPGPSGIRRRRGLLYFWLLIAIGSIWQRGAPLGAPGVGLSDILSVDCPCPSCKLIADRQLDKTFLCPAGHTFALELGPDGSTIRIKEGSLNCHGNQTS